MIFRKSIRNTGKENTDNNEEKGLEENETIRTNDVK